MLKYIKGYIAQSLSLNSLINSVTMPPIESSNLSSSNDIKYNAEVPLCDIIAGMHRKRKNDKTKANMEDSSEEEENVPRVTKTKVVKVISDQSESDDEDKENPNGEKDNDSDYELKKVKPKKKRILSEHQRKKSRNNKKGTLSKERPKSIRLYLKSMEETKRETRVEEVKSVEINQFENLSPYERMIEEKRAERIALLKSMEIDQIKSEISDAISGMKKRNTVSRSYKKAHSPAPVEPIRRSRRLANMEVDFSENALEKLAVKNSFQASPIEYTETLPSELTFKDALKSASTYEECNSDLIIQDTKPGHKLISYNRNAFNNMTLTEFNVCKVVPARITSAAWCPSKDDLVVSAADKYGNLGLWKIKDSETNPHLFRVHAGNIPCMQFCPFNTVQLFTASYDGTIRCGDLVKHSFNEIYASDVHRCTWFDFLSPTTFLVSHSNGDVAVVDRNTIGKTSEERHTCHDFTIKTVNVHPVNKNVFMTADNRKTIRLWDLRKLQKKPVAEIVHHQKSINSAFFSPVTGNSILSTSLDDTICIFDSTNLTEDIKLKKQIKHNNFTGRWLTIFRATWLPNSDDIFAVGSNDQPRRVQIFDRDLNLYHNLVDDYLTTITSVHRFHPSRSALAACNSSGKVFVFT